MAVRSGVRFAAFRKFWPAPAAALALVMGGAAVPASADTPVPLPLPGITVSPPGITLSLNAPVPVPSPSVGDLEATLLAYIRQRTTEIPALAMMQMPAEEIRRRAEAIIAELKPAAKLKAELCAGESVIGGGAAPGAKLPTMLIALTHADLSAESLARRLREVEPLAIIARVEEGRVLLDLRTVFPAQDGYLAEKLNELHGGSRS